MLSLVLMALAQAPVASADVPVAIVVSSRRDTSGNASKLCEQLQAAIGPQAMSEKESIDRLAKLGGVDPHACDGARLCLQKLAQLLHGVVIGVDVSKAGRLTAGHVEAVSFDRVDSLASDDLAADAKSWPGKSAATAKAFAEKLGPQLVAMRPKEPPPPADSELKAPREVVLVPEPAPSPPVFVQAQTRRSSGPLPYLTGGVAVLCLAAGVTFLILGFLDRGNYQRSFQSVPNQTSVASSYTDAQLEGLASGSNAKIAVGSTLAGLALALGITAGVLFAKD